MAKRGRIPILKGDFGRLLGELQQLHDRKAEDYGRDGDSLHNIRSAQDFDIDPWVYSLARVNEKVNRLKNFVQKGTLSNESAEDSLRDIAIHAVISLQLFNESREELDD